MAELEHIDPVMQLVQERTTLTDELASDIHDEQASTGKPVRQILVDMGLLTEDQLLELFADYLGTEVINLPATDVPPDVVHSVPASVARMYSVVPIEVGPNSVKLATCNLISPEVMDELMFVLTRDVSFVMAREDDCQTFINQFYGDDSAAVTDMLSALESEIEDTDALLLGDEEDEHGIEEAAGSTPVIRFVNLVLYQAVNDRASDIHFEPFEKEFKIRYRVDGALYEMRPPAKRLALPIISRVKVMSNLNIAERRLPQDGRIQLTIAGRQIDLRVSTLPTQFGESVVLRVLDRSVVSLDLENLGLPTDVYDQMIADIARPNGIIIVTGPTGSGKTTTLYSCLRRINKIENKLLTAEEPVEYDIEGIIQVPISEVAGNTFHNVLRAFLRQDPDVMMVGEIRDLDTAQISVQAALTGHMVFSTLHTNDAAGAVTRLIDMDVEPFLISSTLTSIVGQRLVRTICTHCKTAYEPDDDLLASLELTREDVAGRPFHYGKGCQHCNDTGYHGRKGIYEYLRVTDTIRQLIDERKPTLIIRDQAIREGMRPLRDDGIRSVLDGYTTAEEILKYT
ncbi:MAG: Flp pilus assembly complex ATPase component TadA [Kiritimatiellae bacterium]|nr:Flp pilus assembly complex ATPase component TadA [Kiritimatiellia bacterium]